MDIFRHLKFIFTINPKLIEQIKDEYEKPKKKRILKIINIKLKYKKVLKKENEKEE